jgi:membrane associated rhomboid family serine protease
VLQNADGTCPACGKAIPPETLKPLVVHSTYAGAGTATDGSPVKRDTPVSAQWTPADQNAGFVYATPEHPMVQFRQQLWKNTPRVYATKGMVVINAAVFILMVLFGVSLMSPDANSLISWGANFGPKTLDGQWWRLLTSMFVHVGLLHVGINMWVLWSNGDLLERLTGNIGFIILYVLSGLFGSLASVYWNPVVASAGASGAVFGVFGGIMGFLVLRRDSVPKNLLAGLRKLGFQLLVYVVITSFAIPWIDNAAHIGGFIAGLLCGLIMSQPLDRVTARSRRNRNLAAIAVGMLGLAVGLWAAPPAPADFRVEVKALDDPDTQVEAVYDNKARQIDTFEKNAMDGWRVAIRNSRTGQLYNKQAAEYLESELLPNWKSVRKQFDEFDFSQLPETTKRRVAKRREYLRLRERAWENYIVAVKMQDPEMMDKYQQDMKAADAIAAEFRS